MVEKIFDKLSTCTSPILNFRVSIGVRFKIRVRFKIKVRFRVRVRVKDRVRDGMEGLVCSSFYQYNGGMEVDIFQMFYHQYTIPGKLSLIFRFINNMFYILVLKVRFKYIKPKLKIIIKIIIILT